MTIMDACTIKGIMDACTIKGMRLQKPSPKLRATVAGGAPLSKAATATTATVSATKI
jgi:hypothetical protein